MATNIGNWQREIDTLLGKVQENKEIEKFKALTSDEERIRYVSQQNLAKSIPWVTFFLENCHQLHQKSPEKASQHRADGNVFFQKRKYKLAEEKYSNAVLFAPPDTEELSLAYGNQSAALLHLGHVRGCLKAVDFALEAGYPEATRYKLVVRRASCLCKLGDVHGTIKAVQEAEDLLEKAEVTEQRKDSVLKEIATIKKSISFEEHVNKTEDERNGSALISGKTDKGEKLESVIPDLCDGPGDVMVQASAALELCCNAEQGRHLVTNRDIRAGDTLIVERPYAAVLLPEHYPTHCHHCYQRLQAFLPCAQCAVVRYCSASCRDKAWTVYHSTECPYTDLLHSVGIAHLGLRVVLVAGRQFLTEFKKRPQETAGEASSRIAGLDLDGKYRRNYQTVYDLMPHSKDMAVEDLFQYALTAGLLLDILKHSKWFQDSDAKCRSEVDGNTESNTPAKRKIDCLDDASNSSNGVPQDISTENQSKIVNNAGDGLVNGNAEKVNQSEEEVESYTYIGGLLLRHIQQLVCNAHAITELQVTTSVESLVEEKQQKRVATAIYPTASLMNHSCDPTIISSFHNDVLVVRAVKDVKKGDEVFNCYGPHYKRMSFRERQAVLRDQYFFTCRCPSCISGQLDEPVPYCLKCSSCSGALREVQDGMLCRDCGYTRTSPSKRQLEGIQEADSKFQQSLQHLQDENYNLALRELLSCRTVCQEVMHRRSKRLAEVEDCIARCYVSLGQFGKAEEHLRKAVQIVEMLFGKESIELANELEKLSDVLFSGRKYKDASSLAEQAVALFTMHYGESHSSISHLNNLQEVCSTFMYAGL